MLSRFIVEVEDFGLQVKCWVLLSGLCNGTGFSGFGAQDWDLGFGIQCLKDLGLHLRRLFWSGSGCFVIEDLFNGDSRRRFVIDQS